MEQSNEKEEQLEEVIITAGSNVSIYDSEKGMELASYKINNIAPRTLSLVAEDYLIGAHATEPKIKLWLISKQKNLELGTFTCCGIVSALTVSSCGTYCAAGIKEEIHIWKVSSGELLNIVTRHYQDISCLRFSQDNSDLISGGKDGHVIVWVFSQIIGVHIERDQVKPRHVWNHHSSEVTDIYPGSMGCVSRVATTSLDMTCKLYELDSGILLSTICMDVPLTSVVMDSMEVQLLLGASNGCIYKIDLSGHVHKEFHFTDLKNIQFKAHEQRVISLSISLDGTKLMSASDDKNCRMWNLETMTCLVNFRMEGCITNAFLAIKPAALYDRKVCVNPPFYVRPFQRGFDDYEEKGLRKYTESKPIPKPRIDLNYPTDFHHKVSCCAAKVGLNNPEQKNHEDIYQESLHGGAIKELQEINNQMYSYLVNHSLDTLSHEMSD